MHRFLTNPILNRSEKRFKDGMFQLDGGTIYFKDYLCHREDGPALIQDNGITAYFINGQYHREDGPAVIYSTGAKEYYQNGQLHREDGPAVEPPKDPKFSNTKSFWLNGKLHRKHGPAVYYTDFVEYWIEGKYLGKFNKCPKKIKEGLTKNEISRLLDGERIGSVKGIFLEDGNIYRVVNGLLHYDYGPAIVLSNGDEFYFEKGLLHRDQRDPIVFKNGYSERWERGKFLWNSLFTRYSVFSSLKKRLSLDDI